MLIAHDGRRPNVDPSAWVAPTAVLSGDVRVGPDCRVLFGAVVTDDGGAVEQHEKIWETQRQLDFPGTVFGVARDTPEVQAAASRRYAELFGVHRSDRPIASA